MSTETLASSATRSGPRGRAAPGFRTDIQALRAIAVTLVLVYHLWPQRLSGGFTGVDVFFVISGFLITGHLLHRPPTSGRGLAEFWARRIRRLLPASLLVLGCTLLASRAVAPETQWDNTARQVTAAAGYVVNWLLAADSVDYLAAESAPSPVQHFWSLSVEEQFYLVWPVLVLVLVLLRRRLPRLRHSVGVGLGMVVLASLAWSVHQTGTSPAAAYFQTPTRIWELGAGGLLAAAVGTGRDGPAGMRGFLPARVLLSLAGLGLIGFAAWSYDGSTPFPGWQAALPVLGTVAVIAARPGREDGPIGRAMACRPVQWLGDVSYSVYLWHWPILTLLPAVRGPLGLADKLAVVVATLILAGLTKVLVEDRFRTLAWAGRLRSTYLLAVLAMAAVMGLAGLQRLEVDHRLVQDRDRLASALQAHSPCFGAAALDPGKDCAPVPVGELLPGPLQAAVDKSDAYADVSGGRNCWSYIPRYRDKRCVFGNPGGKDTVMLVGNSHAGQWLPALQELAAEHDWRIVTRLASRCAFADLRQQFATPEESTACQDWVRRSVDLITAQRPDLVITSNRISSGAEGVPLASSGPLYRDGYQAVLERVAAAGVPVLAIRDTPAPGDGGTASVPDCVAEAGEDYDRCSAPAQEWIPEDPVADAVAGVDDPWVRALDLNAHICGARCTGVVGGVIAYFDGSHLSATYARTLAPYLEEPVRRALARGVPPDRAADG